MNIIFRADANRNIGMGHIMRCLSIADAFQALDHQIIFIIADKGISSFIRDREYEAIVLNSDYKDMESEIDMWPTITPDIIIVDSYFVTEAYFRFLQNKVGCNGGKLIYIDDVYTFPYSVDILVNYNTYSIPSIYDSLYNESKVERPQFILGHSYAPLRSMFKGLAKKVQNEKVQNILISTGGSDDLHLALSILRHLIDSGISKVRKRTYHFLLGAMNTDKESIRTVAENKDFIVLHVNITDMKSLISEMDLVISAAGSTLYEICACGVPLITYSVSDNQIFGAEAFERLRLGINVGDLRDRHSMDSTPVMSGKLKSDAVEIILQATEELASDYKSRIDMGTRMQELIDGFGAERMVQEIMNLTTPASELLTS